MERVVRLHALELNHIKNVVSGKIVMPRMKLESTDRQGMSEILGIYGQNGSGKTAVIDALYYLQRLMLGESLGNDLANYVEVASNTAELKADFYIYEGQTVYEVGYLVQLRRNDSGVVISRESLSSARHTGDGKRSNKIAFMDYDIDNKDIFTPKVRLSELVNSDAGIETDLIVAKKISEKSNCSYIFGENNRDILFQKHEKFDVYCQIVKELFYFALKDLFVIRNSHNGVITANLVLPMAFRIEPSNELGFKGDFAVSLGQPTVVDTEGFHVLEQITEEINTVLPTIIPGMELGIKNHGGQLLEDGQEGYRVELLSLRKGLQPIPIHMESEGIIKIISILSALIQAFANPSVCLAIDELDAGIFEYMLGELLDVFRKSAKGQLIFTSHNLRALEMLQKENIMFSTVNPENRYIHMRNVRETNNMRGKYIRTITLGGQSEMLYEETDSLKIARAFRKAGKGINAVSKE